MVEGIVFDRVTKTYPDVFQRKRTAVDTLSLTIGSGESFGFLGPNGAGKSTAIKILMNVIFPNAGRAFMLGRPVNDKAVRARVGYLPENPHLYDYLTPMELLRFGGETSGMTRVHITERSNILLDLVDLSHVKHQRLRTFSKGMLQRAGVAVALVNDPDIVIFDEPMSGLDPLGRKLMADIIRRLKQDGKTVFFSSHILHDVEDLCDRVGIIVQGRLRRVARLADLVASPSSGWKVSLKAPIELLQSKLTGLTCVCEAQKGFTDIKTPQMDLSKILERLGSLQSEVMAVVPIRPTLEEFVLREIEDAGVKSV